MYRAYRGNRVSGWILPAAVFITGIIQVWILLYTAEWVGALIPVVALGTAALTLVLIFLHQKTSACNGPFPRIAAILAIGLLFIAPVVWSCTPLVYGSGNILPAAGPQALQVRSIPGGISSPLDPERGYSQLAVFLTTHNRGETWVVAVPSSHEAASLIIETGKPVMSLGGFSGSDTILSTESLVALLKTGKVRYFYTPSTTYGSDRASGNSEIFSWVRSHCMAVPSSEYVTGSSNRTSEGSVIPDLAAGNTRPGLQGSQNTLYDCAGAV
jgi:hypothetical protein